MEHTEPKKSLDRRITIFLALTFLLTWGLLFSGIACGIGYGSVKGNVLLSVCMLIPALSSILTRLITKEGFSSMLLRPRLKVKGNAKPYLIACFLPALLILLGGALFFLVMPGSFDPALTEVRTLLGNSPISPAVFILLQTVQALILSPIVNLFFTLGEELGWRGYLLPKLLGETTPAKAIVFSGAIWGLWHAPMIAMGHNFGVGYWGYPYTGVLLMTVFCIFFGAILSYVTLKSGSVIPAGAGHGALNGMAALPALMGTGAYSRLFGPYAMGLISVIPTVAAGLWFMKKATALIAPNAPSPGEKPAA